MHELAVTSGFAAAYRLGADYPFHGDEDCERLFRLYLGLSHGVRMVSQHMPHIRAESADRRLQRKEDREGFLS